ncbi:MAG: c-type cytochrome biogenesis protein CcmI [Pseudomonadota bacterium]
MNSSFAFWGAVALLVVLALAFVLPPLLRTRVTSAQAGRRGINIAVYRDQLREMSVDRDNGLLTPAQYEEAKVELESRLAADALEVEEVAPAVRRGGRSLGYGLAVLLPACAIGFYLTIGNPGAIDAVASQSDAAAGGHDVMKLIAQVEEKAKADPNNAEAWTLLAKTYAVVEHWPEALAAYEKALALRPDEPSVMTGYAEVLAIAKQRDLSGKPMELVLKALEKDPDDLKGLELAGIHNFQQRNFAQAAYYFKRLGKLLPPEAPYAQDIAEAEKEASRLAMAGLNGGMDNLADAGKSAANPGATIKGVVDVAPALKAKVKPEDVVFLFARPGEGGAPVAAIRATAGKFPLEFELSDAMAMTPENALSRFKEVNLTARIAKSGEVKGAPGDLEGSLAKVKVGATGVKLVIDRVRD